VDKARDSYRKYRALGRKDALQTYAQERLDATEKKGRR